MNFKSNKGYTGIDISVAMIIILIFIPTTFGIVYSLQRTRARTEREATAINIATDILEIAKSLNYSDIVLSNSNDSAFKTRLESRYTSATFNGTLDALESNYDYAYYTYADVNNKHYRIQVGVLKYYPDGEENTEDIDFVKRVKVNVTYPVGNSTKSIDISTVLQNNS